MFGAAKKKPALPPLSPFERERCDELISEFQNEVHRHQMSRLELGKVARELKPLYVRLGRKGGWTRFVTKECHQKVRTVDEWISDYEISVGLRKPPEKKANTGNVAGSATFQNATPQVVASDNPDTNGREAVSATFVLTAGEKLLFMAAVNRLSAAEATRRIYEAVVNETAGEHDRQG